MDVRARAWCFETAKEASESVGELHRLNDPEWATDEVTIIANAFAPTITKLVEALRTIGQVNRNVASHTSDCECDRCVARAALAELEKP